MTSSLHILNKAPGHQRAGYCLAQLRGGDRLILMENALLGLVDADWLSALPEDVTVLVLEADLDARGMRKYLNKSMQIIDYKSYVSEIALSGKQLYW
ncbi:MAG: sulfurtransferase complex subunit TusB [Oleiphilaceae bacterium]|nr:sulfurtransferase complex subunit TusB [Oleiphilaceae bacterium]